MVILSIWLLFLMMIQVLYGRVIRSSMASLTLSTYSDPRRVLFPTLFLSLWFWFWFCDAFAGQKHCLCDEQLNEIKEAIRRKVPIFGSHFCYSGWFSPTCVVWIVCLLFELFCVFSLTGWDILFVVCGGYVPQSQQFPQGQEGSCRLIDRLLLAYCLGVSLLWSFPFVGLCDWWRRHSWGAPACRFYRSWWSCKCFPFFSTFNINNLICFSAQDTTALSVGTHIICLIFIRCEFGSQNNIDTTFWFLYVSYGGEVFAFMQEDGEKKAQWKSNSLFQHDKTVMFHHNTFWSLRFLMYVCFFMTSYFRWEQLWLDSTPTSTTISFSKIGDLFAFKSVAFYDF